ncbi:ABC transporter permease [Sneathiella sp. HT1-7]|uniref:ABC transporter permease n=1 Tax=Sneathiella sp. HT1-7 TaxID=2887192 RepID=UPI001D15184F|nr:MlaE family lipid ABC transporter permease subunit [Sneathiella sp. HT1-7]MCC3304328.1 MlaE family lipid ABC transporter permease subunit [Sneathiella sp. HT1-7]
MAEESTSTTTAHQTQRNPAWVKFNNGGMIELGGCWTISEAERLDKELMVIHDGASTKFIFNLSGLERLDTAGAWLIHRTRKSLESGGAEVILEGMKPEYGILLDEVAANDQSPPPLPHANQLLEWVAHTGEMTLDALARARDFLGFFGLVILTLSRSVSHPARLRIVPMIHHMEKVGLNALPIVGLISFLIGVVIAYQGASQMKQFGAEVFVVNLIAVSILREIGILLAAIVIAGRSASAFTAQIGAMKVNEEIDAMRTLGLDPIEVLVLPRLLALVLAMPLLAFFADMIGLLGGGLMTWIVLDIRPDQFIERLSDAVSLWSFWIGIIKAPFFAVIIALVGCYEGFQVGGSAESVGHMTSRSVVESIFLVIVADAIFSIFFQLAGV